MTKLWCLYLSKESEYKDGDLRKLGVNSTLMSPRRLSCDDDFDGDFELDERCIL